MCVGTLLGHSKTCDFGNNVRNARNILEESLRTVNGLDPLGTTLKPSGLKPCLGAEVLPPYTG